MTTKACLTVTESFSLFGGAIHRSSETYYLLFQCHKNIERTAKVLAL